jgi:hypothetical protein
LQVPPQEAAFLLESDDLCLLDLAGGPPCKAYRLEADVRHDDGPGLVGAYIARQLIRRPDGNRHVFLLLSLFEARGGRGGNARFQMGLYHDAGIGELGGAQIGQLRIRVRPRHAAVPIRHLAIEAGPKDCRAFLDGELVAVATPAMLASTARRLKVPEWRPDAGAAGAYLRESKARFAQIRLVEST